MLLFLKLNPDGLARSDQPVEEVQSEGPEGDIVFSVR